MATRKRKVKKAEKTTGFSWAAYIVGIAIGFVLFSGVAYMSNVSNPIEVLILMLVLGNGIVTGISVLCISYGIDNDSQEIKDFGIGLLGIVIGFIPASLLKNVKSMEGKDLIISLFVTWLSTLCIVDLLVFILAIFVA